MIFAADKHPNFMSPFSYCLNRFLIGLIWIMRNFAKSRIHQTSLSTIPHTTHRDWNYQHYRTRTQPSPATASVRVNKYLIGLCSVWQHTLAKPRQQEVYIFTVPLKFQWVPKNPLDIVGSIVLNFYVKDVWWNLVSKWQNVLILLVPNYGKSWHQTDDRGGGGGAVWQCCYILLHTLEVKVSVSWLLLCKVACYRNKVKPCTVLYCTVLHCTVLACYRNKVKPAVKMSDDVNSVVLSPVTSYTTHQGAAGATELAKSAKSWQLVKMS